MSGRTALDAEDAIALLPDEDPVHTFTAGMNGAYWDRDRIIVAVRSSPGRWLMEPTTGAYKAGHRLAIEHPLHPGVFLFIETREAAL